MCHDQTELTDLGNQGGHYLNGFSDKYFGCDSLVIGWEVYAWETGTFYIDILRYVSAEIYTVLDIVELVSMHVCIFIL